MATPDARFWSKVSGGDVTECWVWTAGTNGVGYGTFYPKPRKPSLAHRWAYEALRSEIPGGLQLDHLCHNRSCVNPWHLEPVTQRVNLLRGETAAARRFAQSACENGHPFDAANTYRRPNGTRACRRCGRERARAYRAAKRLAGASPVHTNQQGARTA